MNILFAASECVPFVKTGGLADVAAALAKALTSIGYEVAVLLPAYGRLASLAAEGRTVADLSALADGARLVAHRAEGLDLRLIDAPALYDRPGGPYLDADGRDHADNFARFALVSRVAAGIARGAYGAFRPDVVHAHDWQAGLVPAYLSLSEGPKVPTVMTIHNIAFQGVFPAWRMDDIALPARGFRIEGFEYWGQVSYLKAGLAYSDAITTVSPTYAREILTGDYGMGMEGILSARRKRLTGILNGIDLSVWDPASDDDLAARYDASTLARRTVNRAALLERFGIALPEDAPLFCVVSRLTGQKGMDLLVEALPAILDAGGGLVVLGSGEPRIEAAFQAASDRHERVGFVRGYDEALSHLCQGGADVILIPSRFEPCGLTQLYGLRYGCVPLVCRTGGLADTVIDANEAALVADVATGFQFAPATVSALSAAIERAMTLFEDRERWQAMMRRGMAHPVGWDRSAAAYEALYQGLLAPTGNGIQHDGR